MSHSSPEQSESFTWPLESTNVVLTGTHSSGKSTLLAGLEQGKITDFDANFPFSSTLHVGAIDLRTDDLGYGTLESSQGQRFLITVPETARWLADTVGRPDLLAENYTIEFQRYIDELSTYRIGAAVSATSAVMDELINRGSLQDSKIARQPLIVSDRGPLDGDIYSKHRMGTSHTDSVNGLPWVGRHAQWTLQQVEMVIVSDESDVPFERDAARLDDIDFRKKIAHKVLENYAGFMPADSLVLVSGSIEDRLSHTRALIANLQRSQKGTPLLLSDEDQLSFTAK